MPASFGGIQTGNREPYAIMIANRPDLAFVVAIFSEHTENPTNRIW